MYKELSPTKSSVTKQDIVQYFSTLDVETNAKNSTKIINAMSTYVKAWHADNYYTDALVSVKGRDPALNIKFWVSAKNEVACFSTYIDHCGGMTLIVEAADESYLDAKLYFRSDFRMSIDNILRDLQLDRMSIKVIPLLVHVNPFNHQVGAYNNVKALSIKSAGIEPIMQVIKQLSEWG